MAVFSASPVDAVIHFAGLKAVGESVEKPLEYYRNNISGSMAGRPLSAQYSGAHSS